MPSLGFLKDSMLWIEKMPTSEDIWIAWVLKETSKDEDEESDIKNTRLSQHYYRATIMFFARMLSLIEYQDIIVRDHYYDLSDEDQFLAASNIM